MIVPRYWAEARLQQGRAGRTVTVRRFGWSNDSEADAQASAEQRCRDAMDRIVAGERLPRREPKVAYNGADGMPIREEIVSEHGATIITRNLYGALCLNTPNVLFADIDFDESPTGARALGIFAVLLVLVLGAATGAASVAIAIWGGLLALALSWGLALLWKKRQPVPELAALERIDRFLDAHPGWGMRVYRTPAGLRVLVTHRTFMSDDPEVAQCFKSLDVDPVYARMCANQQCFRARVSPKPWRIGMTQRLRPRPGVWPVSAEHWPARQHWVKAYQEKAQDFASCALISSLGNPDCDEEVAAVMQLHDELSAAASGRPLA